MANKRGLGKGLSALFDDADTEYEVEASDYFGVSAEKEDNGLEAFFPSAAKPAEKQRPVFEPALKEAVTAAAPLSGGALNIQLSQIFANPDQPRKNFKQEALKELADSIILHGVIQPVIAVKKGDKYMLVAGERRYRAAGVAGLSQIPVIVRDLTREEIAELSLIENLQREDLNAVEAAYAVKYIIDSFGLTQDEVAKRIGKSRPAVANLLRLLTLPAEILAYVREGRLSEGHARALIGMSLEKAAELAELASSRGMSVREMEKAAKDLADVKPKEKMPPRPGAATPAQSRELKDLLVQMQRVLGTKVTAVGTDTKGRIYIDYFSRDDIDRIFDVIEKLK